MTLQEFKNKYLGKQVEYHSFGSGAYNQCVDLVNQYIVEALGFTPIIGTNAKDFPARYNTEEFDWIPNDPVAIPKRGDIPIWNGNVGGGAGHTAIVLSATVNAMNTLDQNWSIVERVTPEIHGYNNVSGWLHPKHGIIEEEDKVSDISSKKAVQFDKILIEAHKRSIASDDKNKVSDINGEKAVQFDKILIEAHKRSIASDDKSENWLDDKLVKRLFDHIDTQEKHIRQVNQELAICEQNDVIPQLTSESQPTGNTELPSPMSGSFLTRLINKLFKWFK